MSCHAISELFQTASPEEIRRRVREALGERAALVVVFASPAHPLGEITALLALDHDTVIGCSSAGEFVGTQETKGGVSVFAIAGELVAFAGIGSALKEGTVAAIDEALSGQPTEVADFPFRTGLLLLDPLSGVGEEAALLVAEKLGDIPLAGGAAGDDLAMRATFVAAGARCASNAIVIAQVFSKAPLGLGVRHGHRPLSGPLTVTSADEAVVLTLDGKPAWEVWKDETRQAAALAGIDVDGLSPEEEGAFLLRFEGGLTTLDETKVRAPLRRLPNGGIAFATAVPEGSVLRITESSAASQIESAFVAARAASDALFGAPIAGALVFDCICRNLILGADFGRAVARMSEALGGAPIVGFETYGEIALHHGALSGFHNTTSVVLAFPRGT
jgi:methyl-accepting chemotaxis protein